MTQRNPQNPYLSYAVCASAGCGKTYQLARRFLFLVGAGASPANILTITFTKKAAAEMRERILMMTAQLLTRKDQCEMFEEGLAAFYQAAAAAPMPFGTYRFCPPRSGEATAREILAATQLLKITTIDSVFLDWYQKFPWEAGIGRGDIQKIRPQHVEILSRAESVRIDKVAWELTFAELLASRSIQGVAELAAPFGVMKLASRVMELMGHGSYLWLARETSSDPSNASLMLRRFAGQIDALGPKNEHELLTLMTDDLHELASLLSDDKRTGVQTAMAQGSLRALRTSGVLNGDMMISGHALRAKKREANSDLVARLEDSIRCFENERKIAALTAAGLDLVTLYGRFSEHREKLKAGAGFMEFNDTAEGCYTIFTEPEAAGARFLIHKNVHHLLLDEFQDTSLMQWSLFSTLAREMLAGAGLMPSEGGPLPSLFIVGDDKQSIYGFREADPSILTNARDTIEPLGAMSVPLNDSYRSSPLILDFVCEHFAQRLDTFPLHATATVDGEPVVPDHGTVVIAEEFSSTKESEDGKQGAREREAAHVAALLRDAIYGESPHQVYDKKLRGYRSLRQGDCAILYRAATHALVYEKALHEVGLKGRLLEGKGFFKRPETTDLMALVRFLAFPTDLLSLSVVLKSPLCGIKDGDVLSALHESLAYKRLEVCRTSYLLELIGQSHAAVSTRLGAALTAVHQRPAGQLLLEIVGTWDVASRYRASLPAEEQLLTCANISRFGEICVGLQGEGIRSIHALAHRLENMKENEDLSNASLADDTISLMTIHKAKGLEFPLVVLVDAAQNWTKTDPYWVKAPFDETAKGIYYIGTKKEQPLRHADFERIVNRDKKSAGEENLRLLYVALTRAGQYLYVTGAAALRGESVGDEVGFLAGLAQSAKALGAKETVVHSHPCLIMRREDPELANRLRNGETPIQAGIMPELSMSCGSQAEEEGEVSVLLPHRLLQKAEEDDNPKGGAGAAQRGTLIHKALQASVRGEPFDIEACWRSLVRSSSLVDQDQLLREASVEIARVVASQSLAELLSGAVLVRTEQPFVHLDGGMLVRGTIDLVVQKESPTSHWIVDYKTTPVAAGCEIATLAALCEARGYHAQLSAYAKAVRAMAPSAVIHAGIYFTATGQFVELPV